MISGIFLTGVLMAAPAHRIVSLAPNVTEFLFAIGAGDRVVGVSAYSNYPEAAKKIPIVADYSGLDLEKIIALHPDLVIAYDSEAEWGAWNVLKNQLSIPVYVVHVHTLSDIPREMRAMGQLTGTEQIAEQRAKEFDEHYQALLKRYAALPKRTVFYALSMSPPMTLNKNSLANQLIEACHGVNVFAQAEISAPEISLGALWQKNPEIILLAKKSDETWSLQALKGLSAVRDHRVYVINPDWVNRPGPRSLLGMEQVCSTIAFTR